MNSNTPIEELLRWRLHQAEAEAPPAPPAARLLALARPWWEALPERFNALVERLGRIQVAYAYAQAEPGYTEPDAKRLVNRFIQWKNRRLTERISGAAG